MGKGNPWIDCVLILRLGAGPSMGGALWVLNEGVFL